MTAIIVSDEGGRDQNFARENVLLSEREGDFSRGGGALSHRAVRGLYGQMLMYEYI